MRNQSIPRFSPQSFRALRFVRRHGAGWILCALAFQAALGERSRAQEAPPAQPVPSVSDAPGPVATFLQRRILDPDVAFEEVRLFLENRIPRMPAASDPAEWTRQAQALREQMFERVVFRGEAAAWRSAKTKVEWLEVIEGGPGYKLKKLRYEALPGMWIPALLYEPDNLSGKVPVILNVNGHDAKGKAAPYKQIRCINQAKRGMLALNVEWFGMGQLGGRMAEHYRMNQLDLCGTSGLAPFYLAMSRGLDLLLSLENADPERVAVTGLSGGGWQTIYISALDPRVKLSNPVAGYSSFLTRTRNLSDLGDSEQTPNDMATVADYTHLTAMLAPRPALLTYNSKDECCFASAHALPPLLAAADPVYKLFHAGDRLRSHVNHDPGTHNYEKENREEFYRMLQDHFYRGAMPSGFQEIPSEDEVKTEEELQVALPRPNADFHSLALELMKELPREAVLPADASEARRWQQAQRLKLHETVRTRNYTVNAEEAGRAETNGITATFWKLRLSGIWTVSAVELVRGEPKGTTLLVADAGRTNSLEQANRLLALGNRVLAIDPFYFGENKIKSRDHLFALLAAAVGERPLGIQASQLIAIARWSHGHHRTGPVAIVALGPRSSLFTLVAAALENQVIDGIELHGALGSLKEVIERNWAVNEKPELFCFGLLEAFDVRQLVALAAPTPVVFPDSTERVRTELAPILDWYKLLGAEFRPW